MRDSPVEERVGTSRLLVHVRVERVAGELREVLDVGEGHLARPGHDAVADAQFGKRLPERVDALGTRGAGHPAVRHRAENARRGLHGRALHVVQYAADAAHLLTAARAPGAAVHEHGQWRAVAGRFAGVVAVEDEQAPVPRRYAKDDGPGE